MKARSTNRAEPFRGPWQRTASWICAAALGAHAAIANACEKNKPELHRPSGNDYTAASLLAHQKAVMARYGGSSRNVPLAVKADEYEWAIVRYHLAPYHQMHVRVVLPEKTGQRPNYHYGADTSTWNGALLAAWSYKYAVTREPATLKLICRLLDGMHLFLSVTGKSGLPARCVLRRDTPFHKAANRCTAADGTVYHYYGDPAKGTVNQIIAGYAALMMHVEHALPARYRKMARGDMTSIALHLVDHDYRLTEKSGRRTTYGNLTPRIGSVGVPFNAQVAFAIVAAGTYFPPADAAQFARLRRAFKTLKNKHHVYYENPLYNVVRPQQIAAGPFLKGMNDRNHVINAAYVGLALEIDSARRQKRKPEREFLYQLGRTMYWGMQAIQDEHHALCNFMWAGVLSNPRAFRYVVPDERKAARRQADRLAAAGVEQLRRFPVDRFYYPGREVKSRKPQWVDARKRHNSYLWKSDAFRIWQITGPATTTHIASVDFLYAYWLMRYYRLQR